MTGSDLAQWRERRDELDELRTQLAGQIKQWESQARELERQFEAQVRPIRQQVQALEVQLFRAEDELRQLDVAIDAAERMGRP